MTSIAGENVSKISVDPKRGSSSRRHKSQPASGIKTQSNLSFVLGRKTGHGKFCSWGLKRDRIIIIMVYSFNNLKLTVFMLINEIT